MRRCLVCITEFVTREDSKNSNRMINVRWFSAPFSLIIKFCISVLPVDWCFLLTGGGGNQFEQKFSLIQLVSNFVHLFWLYNMVWFVAPTPFSCYFAACGCAGMLASCYRVMFVALPHIAAGCISRRIQ